MDLTNINPSAYADQDRFPIGEGKFLTIPTVAKGQAVTAASRKLQRGVEIYEGVTLRVPDGEAMAIASAVVDPTQLRLDVERKRVSMHRTPSGYTLVSIEARVWAAGISSDGANGRGRLEVKLAGGSVWPLPAEDGADPTMHYTTRDLSRMRDAVRNNARRIGSPDMRQSLRDHPNGVWNPVYLVPGLITVQDDPEGEATSEDAFVHTAEGSTRAVTSQEGLGIAPDEAVAHAGTTLDLVRRVRAGVANRLATTPDDEDARHAVKVLTLPAHIIVGVLDCDHQVSGKPFPEVVSEFVQSIHEQPRPWNALAQGGVRGERLVLDLVDAGRLSESEGDDITGRDEHHESTVPANVVAGRLVRATSHPDSRELVRRAILEDPKRQQLTRKRYAQTVGPLLLTLYPRDSRQKTAAAALTNEFQPEALIDRSWTIHEKVSLPELLEQTLAALEARPGQLSTPSRELIARTLGALTNLGLVLSDQGSAVGDQTWLRGPVAKVVTGLATCAGGLRILAEAGEYIEGRQDLPPLLYDADGEPALDAEGRQQRLVPEAGSNVKLRRLAFRANRPDETGVDDEELAPYDRFIAAQRHAMATFAAFGDEIDQLYGLRGDADEVLVDEHGLRRDIMGELPAKIGELRDLILVSLQEEPEPFEEDDTDDQDALQAIEDAMDKTEPDEYDEAA